MSLEEIKRMVLNKNCSLHITTEDAVELFCRGTFCEMDDFGQFIGEGDIELVTINWEKVFAEQISNEELEISCGNTCINIHVLL